MKIFAMVTGVLCVALCMSGCEPDNVNSSNAYYYETCVNNVEYIVFWHAGISIERNPDGSIVQCKVEGEE